MSQLTARSLISVPRRHEHVTFVPIHQRVGACNTGELGHVSLLSVASPASRYKQDLHYEIVLYSRKGFKTGYDLEFLFHTLPPARETRFQDRKAAFFVLTLPPLVISYFW